MVAKEHQAQPRAMASTLDGLQVPRPLEIEEPEPAASSRRGSDG